MASKTVTKSIGITIGNKTQNKVKIYVYFTDILSTEYHDFLFVQLHKHVPFSPKTLEGSKFRQISNLAFIVPRPRRSFGQVVSDNKVRHPRLLLTWVSENIKKTSLKSRRIEVKTNNKGDQDDGGDNFAVNEGI